MKNNKNLNVPNWRLSECNQTCLNSRTRGNYPNLRFPEFSGEWVERKLGEIAILSKGKGISKSDISENASLECIRYGQLYTHYSEVIDEVISKTNICKDKLVLSEANDVIIPASGESQIDIATASCVIKDGIALGGDLNIIKSDVNGVFMSYYLNNAKKLDIAKLAQGISVVHLYASQLKSLKLNIPSQDEQIKTATFFSLLDKRIQTQSKIIEDYKLLKKGMMQKIFKQELRFKDENSNDFPEWEKKKLGKLTFKTGVKNKKRLLLPVYSINNKEGFLPQSEQFDGIDSNARGFDTSMYKIIGKNTFAYNPARINVGSIGYSGELENIIISSLYVCFQTEQLLDASYLWHFMKTFTFNKSVLRNVEGGVRDYLFYENFSNIEIPLPSIKEQVKISRTLSAIDKKIELETEYLTKLKTQKQYLLQNLFV